ncbi:hypothetical protein BJV74DRAFT_844059 [Russula compacta]|nr:hypothetical protein BJV74DRAFT_844059 [Russula compacta]
MSLSAGPPPLPTVDEIVRGLHRATIAKYLSVAGLVALLYDHVLTLNDEIQLIWSAPRSFAKWIFLVNRYLSTVCLLAVAHEMSGLHGHSFDDQSCQILLTIVFCYSLFSVFTANLLAFLRVVVLWDKSPRILFGLSILFILSFFVSVGGLIASVVLLLPSVKYGALSQACYLTKTSPMFVVLWVSPLVFVIPALSLTAYNALSRPRGSKTTLMRVLHRDGMLFFLIVTLLRVMNVAFSTLTEPGLIGLPIYFSWAMVLLAINRMLIHIRSSEKGTEDDESESNEIVVVTSSTLPMFAESSCRSSTRIGSAIELDGYSAK